MTVATHQHLTSMWIRLVHQFPARDDRGEGVISAAIAVLIVAALGALMWVGFRAIWQTAETATNNQISQIGG